MSDRDDAELRLDHARPARTGLAEAVYAPGKTPALCAEAVAGLVTGGTAPVLLTRADDQQVAAALELCPGGRVVDVGNDRSTGRRISVVAWQEVGGLTGDVVVVSAGTADLPVAREAATTLTAYGWSPATVTDVGVAGLHRVLDEADRLARADAVIVVAGMEGALASVVAGLTAAPVVAVPTSTGYGAGLEGITALLAMHASCSPGITVVGIDNGFGAACAVARMLRPLHAARSATAGTERRAAG